MLAAHQLPPKPIPKALRPRQRGARRPFNPSNDTGPYRLPPAVRERLTVALAPFRNREAAFALAVFLGRFWAVPSRVSGSFPVDRRALRDREGLDLTEGQVRGAIRTLEGVGFLDRVERKGSAYRVANDGGLQRKAVQFVFGPEAKAGFIAAIKRATVFRERGSRCRQEFGTSGSAGASCAKFPKRIHLSQKALLMGQQPSQKRPQEPPEVNPRLEAALSRLQAALRRETEI